MSLDYAGMAATVTRLLGDNGQPVTLRKSVGATYDPVTGTYSGGSTQDLPMVGVFVQISSQYKLANNVQDGDRLMWVDASQTPAMGDSIVVVADVLKIMSVDAVSPAGTPLAYKLQVRP
ncbi:MAG TPA: hypothetical protein VFP92_10840 [Rhodanobacteraceae bacterium]|nr:hypothetical protein [Rhodanobacteraceae bacterium]